MRLGIDARIMANKPSGISTYIYNLVKNLLDLDEELEIFLFSDNNFYPFYDRIFNSTRLKKVVLRLTKKEKKKWSRIFLPQKLKEYKIDIYHATWNNAVPFFKGCPCVLTIHDLIPWVLPGHFANRTKALRYKLRHFTCAHLADRVITDSYKSKNDIIRLCKVRETKIKVIYLGWDEEFKKEANAKKVKEVLAKYNLTSKQYLLDPIGIDHPRRNSIFVLEGFNELLKREYHNFKLVYTGNFYPENNQYRNLQGKIRELRLEKKVIITGWIPQEDLIVLLSNAKISIIPSLYEGFCLPVLESFACGIPVIATNRGSIPEVTAEAAILIEPVKYHILADKIELLLKSEILIKNLVEKGKERLNFFCWRKTAYETLAIYKNLTKEKLRSNR